jgi:hypothetical protein
MCFTTYRYLQILILLLKISIFGEVTPCSLLGTCCLYRKVRFIYPASHPRRILIVRTVMSSNLVSIFTIFFITLSLLCYFHIFIFKCSPLSDQFQVSDYWLIRVILLFISFLRRPSGILLAHFRNHIFRFFFSKC